MIARATGAVSRLLPHRADYAELPRSWRRDILAGVTVGVVALPLALCESEAMRWNGELVAAAPTFTVRELLVFSMKNSNCKAARLPAQRLL